MLITNFPVLETCIHSFGVLLNWGYLSCRRSASASAVQLTFRVYRIGSRQMMDFPAHPSPSYPSNTASSCRRPAKPEDKQFERLVGSRMHVAMLSFGLEEAFLASGLRKLCTGPGGRVNVLAPLRPPAVLDQAVLRSAFLSLVPSVS